MPAEKTQKVVGATSLKGFENWKGRMKTISWK